MKELIEQKRKNRLPKDSSAVSKAKGKRPAAFSSAPEEFAQGTSTSAS
jgi:hypothetical protein